MQKLLLGLGLVGLAGALYALEFTGPDIEPVNWESRQLTVVDFDGDGREDLSMIDGVARAIDVYVQKQTPQMVEEPKLANQQPVMRLSRFDKQRIVLDHNPASFAWGDFSGDGKMELAYVAVGKGLYFLAMDSKGVWRTRKHIVDLEPLSFTHNLWVGSLSKGAPQKLIGLFKNEIVLFEDYAITQRYSTLQSTPTFLNVTDINGDGLEDLVYEYRSPAKIAYRLQDADGNFWVERQMEYNSETEKVFSFEGNRWSFFGGVESYLRESILMDDEDKPQVDFYGMNFSASVALMADVDADLSSEWVVCDPQRGVVQLWRTQGDELWAKQGDYPSYKGISEAAWDGKDSLLVFSKTEKIVGAVRWQNNRMTFPRALDLPYTPFGLVERLDKAWVVQTKQGKYYLQRAQAEELKTSAMELPGIAREPEAFVGFEVSKDGPFLLAVLQPRDEVLFYLVDDKSVEPVEVAKALTLNILNNIDKKSLGVADLDGDGTKELILASKEMLRIFKLEGKSLRLQDQALSGSSAADLRLPIVWEGSLWVYEKRRDMWLNFDRDASGVWAQTQKNFEAGAEPLSVVGIDKNQWVMLSRNGLFVLKPQTNALGVELDRYWESDLNLGGYNWGMLEDLGPQKYYIMYNQPERILEFIDTQKLKTSLNFKLYDRDLHYKGRKGEDIEPREIVVADITNDGLPDLAMLMHDNLIVYPQSAPEDTK